MHHKAVEKRENNLIPNNIKLGANNPYSVAGAHTKYDSPIDRQQAVFLADK